jgi:hypothetical protein
MINRTLRIMLVSLAVASPATAQSFEAGAHFAWSQWSEFEGRDLGVGGRLTWKPIATVGIDADLSWYPAEFPPDGVAFSGSRFEGLFGATVGPRLDRLRPFVKAAAGFLRAGESPEPFVCIAIFPPPLACLMAAGQTLPAIEIGGGLELSPTSATFVRVDVADRLLRYPAPSLDDDFELHEERFWGHALRITIGGGIRF